MLTFPCSSSSSRGSGPTQTGQDGSSDRGTATKKINAGAIAGGIIGGLAVLGICVALVIVWMRRSRQRPATVSSIDEIEHFVYAHTDDSPYNNDLSQVVTPFVLPPSRPPPALASGSSGKFSNPPTAPTPPPAPAEGGSAALATAEKPLQHTAQPPPPTSSHIQRDSNERQAQVALVAEPGPSLVQLQPLSMEDLLSMLQTQLQRARSVTTEVSAPPAYTPPH